MKLASLILIVGFFLTGSVFTSCKKNPVSSQCDTCGRNNDSIAHAFTWTEHIGDIPGEVDITGCWVFGQNDIYINGTYLWHYDGTVFTKMPAIRKASGTQLGFADDNMFALSKTDFWLISTGALLHTLDGKNFDDLRPSGEYNACWGTSSNDMFFVGNGGLIYHFDGTNFTKMTSNTTKDLRSVWGTSHNDVWATGWNSSKGETVLMHYDGNSWSEDQFSSSGTINKYAIGTVWACDSIGHSIAVIAGTRVFHKTDNGVWRGDTSEVGNSLGGGSYIGIGAYGGTSSDLFAIGSWGFISHWNGKTWYQYKQFFDYSNNDYYGAAFSMNGNTACVVGTKGGASWVAIGQRKQ
jgi:hypothetical protein